MQSNMTASTTATFAPNLNFNSNQSLSFLQHQQPQQTPQIQQNFLNNSYINDMNPNILQSSLQTKDTTFTKIFVGGLPYHTTDESLGQFFKKFGNIEEAVVINDRQTGKSRGYGFVTMETRDAAEAAVLDPNPIIDGRKSNVNLAYLGVKSRIIAPTGMIPLAVRYQLPTTQSAYGFHPFYYHPAQTATTNPQHTPYLATPNLLIPAQRQSTNLIQTTGPAQATAGLFDLAYNGQHVQPLNSNRTSPFENSINSTSASGFSIPYNVNNSHHQTVNTLISQASQHQPSNIGYFTALPQHISNVFQSQERL